MSRSAHLRLWGVDTRVYESVRKRSLAVDVVGQYIWLSGNGEERYHF